MKNSPLIIGLDISTAAIGVCIFEKQTQKLIVLEAIKLNSKTLTSLWLKADEAQRQLEDILQQNNIDKNNIIKIFVEENAKVFATGFSSADTLMTLAKFNGIFSYICYKLFPNATIDDINVSTARSTIGIKINRKDKTLSTKEKVFQTVLILYPNVPFPKHVAKSGKSAGQMVYDVVARDMCDAFVLAKAGMILKG